MSDFSWSLPESPGGIRRFDVRRYGAFPDVYAYCSDTIQAAIDAASAVSEAGAASSILVEVYLPTTSTAYRLQRPLRINSPGVRLVGPEGRAVLSCQGDFPAVILGLPTTGGQAMDISYRPDAFGLGVLDSTGVSAAGQRNGFRSKRNAFICMQETGWDMGIHMPNDRPDRYQTLQTLTFEMCLTPGDTTIHTLTPVGFIAGAGPVFKESPFTFNAVDGSNGNTDLCVRFRTADQARGGQTTWSFQCHLSGTGAGQTNIPGPWDIAFQMDLLNGVYGFWVNGIRRALTVSSLPSAGKNFTPNLYNAFYFLAGPGPQPPMTEIPNPYPDLAIWGARLSNTLVYNWGTVGSTQTRAIDINPVNSDTRYFATSGADTTTMAFLPMVDVSNGEAIHSGYHHVLSLGETGSPTQMGYFLTSTYIKGALDMAVENIDINTASDSAGKKSGYGIMIGSCLYPRIKHCKIKSGGYSIGSINIGATYVVYVDDCDMDGADSNVWFFFTHVILTNCKFTNCGSIGAAKFAGCRATMKGSFSEDSDNSPLTLVAMFDGAYDAQYIIEDWLSDTESGGFKWAAFYAQGNAYTGTRLDLSNVTVFNVGHGAMVWLDDGAPFGDVYQRSYFTSRNLNGAGGRSLIKVSGEGWQGRIDSTGGYLYPRIDHTLEFSTNTNVKVIDHGIEPRFFDPSNYSILGQPQEGYWIQGAHEIHTLRPLPGQFTEWAVTTTGMCGSSTQPVFSGVNPLSAPWGTLIGYSGSNDRATAVLTA